MADEGEIDEATLKAQQEKEKCLKIDEMQIMQDMEEEELQQLLCDIADMDPDNTMLPAGYRQRDQTAKDPTGELDRDKLMTTLEEDALKLPDQEEEVPFVVGTKKGKVFKQKEITISNNPYADDSADSGPVNLDAEVERGLQNATDLELTDLAAVLGLYKMLNNQQFYDAQGAGDQMVCTESWKDNTKCKLPLLPIEDEPNTIDVEAALEQVKKNDSTLTDLNLNNVCNIQISTLLEFFEALKGNNTVTSFSIANTKANDEVAKACADMLAANSTLTSINVETNFITTEGIILMLEPLRQNKTLVELRIANQRQKLANKAEDYLMNVLEENTSIKKLGYTFSCAGPRHCCGSFLTRNVDLARQKRTGKV